MTFVRTVLGDIDPAEMGVTYAHEHLVIDGGRPVDMSPDFLLADVNLLADELGDAATAGLRTAIDAMPALALAARMIGLLTALEIGTRSVSGS